MKKSLLKLGIYASLLLSILSFSQSCKRELALSPSPYLAKKISVSRAKNYVDSLNSQLGDSSFMKKMALEANWNRAIIDSLGNVRVPVSFNLEKLKPTNGKPIQNGKIKDVFELFIREKEGELEASVLHFTKLSDKLYPIRHLLNGQVKSKLIASISLKDLNALQKISGGNKLLASVNNKLMIYKSEFTSLIETTYGGNVTDWAVYECPPATHFDPTTCICENLYNVTTNPYPYPELYMILVRNFTYEYVAYPFGFHGSQIVDDPEIPEDPIDPNSNVDCAGVTGGTAYLADCGCIGGTTGIPNCDELGDDPNTTPTAVVVEIPPSILQYRF
ncbi:hypothetical protein [Pedobacter sp. MW01-1-1]|uniref:hypothetical protein n=1 Tax=Pedobacter sp. MW01-1-1 TaxID=3383027 RepID=UPI003FED9FF9